jgi:hypothetical protein
MFSLCLLVLSSQGLHCSYGTCLVLDILRCFKRIKRIRDGKSHHSTERFPISSASYNSDVGQSSCMSDQQNGNDVARGEHNPTTRITND